MTLLPYQQAIVAFLARAKGPDDRVVLLNHKLMWASELPRFIPRPLSTGSLRGLRADVMMLDDGSFTGDKSYVISAPISP